MMSGRLARLALVCTLFTVTSAPATSQGTPDAPQASAAERPFDAAALREEVRAVMQRERIPGVQIIAFGPNGDIWRMTDGLADIAGNKPMTPDTRVQIGSVTKVFTASLIADLVAAKKLSWTDTLGKIFPDVPMQLDIAAISLADLASHTSRLPKDPPNRVDVDGTWRPYTRAELYAALGDPSLKLVDPDWNYSNFGFAILGHVVEKATGMPYERVLRERILDPLGMASTSIALTPEQEATLAVHYWPEDNPLKARLRWKFGEIAGFGGLSSTAADLAKFVAFQLDPRAFPNVLDPRAILGMRTARIMFPDWKIGFGRPWIERRDGSGTLILEHGGEVDGHSAIIMLAPSFGVGVVATANLGQDGAESVARPVFEWALDFVRPQDKPSG